MNQLDWQSLINTNTHPAVVEYFIKNFATLDLWLISNGPTARNMALGSAWVRDDGYQIHLALYSKEMGLLLILSFLIYR